MDSSSPIGINVPNWLLRHQLTVKPEESTIKISRVGVDLAKNVFQLHGVDRHGETVLKRRLSREKWIRVLVNSAEPGCEIGMEACGGAHHWARLLMKKGFRVKLIPPQFVTPYVKSNKNDAKDAEAICEAMSRPTMHFVKAKTVEQQDIQATHRIRRELMCHRTAKANQIRGLVTEYGLIAPLQMASLRVAIPRWLEDAENGLTERFRALLHGLWDDLLMLDQRIEVHGARAVVAQAKHKEDRLSRWVTGLAERRHPNVAAVALANKTVRMAWAMMNHDADYDPDFAVN